MASLTSIQKEEKAKNERKLHLQTLISDTSQPFIHRRRASLELALLSSNNDDHSKKTVDSAVNEKEIAELIVHSSGVVSRTTAERERDIRRNVERQRREEAILNIEAQLKERGVKKCVERRRRLEQELVRAKEEIKRWEMGEDEEEIHNDDDDDDDDSMGEVKGGLDRLELVDDDDDNVDNTGEKACIIPPSPTEISHDNMLLSSFQEDQLADLEQQILLLKRELKKTKRELETTQIELELKDTTVNYLNAKVNELETENNTRVTHLEEQVESLRGEMIANQLVHDEVEVLLADSMDNTRDAEEAMEEALAQAEESKAAELVAQSTCTKLREQIELLQKQNDELGSLKHVQEKDTKWSRVAAAALPSSENSPQQTEMESYIQKMQEDINLKKEEFDTAQSELERRDRISSQMMEATNHNRRVSDLDQSVCTLETMCTEQSYAEEEANKLAILNLELKLARIAREKAQMEAELEEMRYLLAEATTNALKEQMDKDLEEMRRLLVEAQQRARDAQKRANEAEQLANEAKQQQQARAPTKTLERLVYQLSCRNCSKGENRNVIGKTFQDPLEVYLQFAEEAADAAASSFKKSRRSSVDSMDGSNSKVLSREEAFVQHLGSHIPKKIAKKRKDAIKYCKKIMKCEILTNEKGEALYWRDFVEGEEEDFESLIGM